MADMKGSCHTVALKVMCRGIHSGLLSQYVAFVHKSRLKNAPVDLSEVIEAVNTFLSPLAEALASGGSFQGTWKPPGPWKE